ncbi:gamma-aminobutyric acid receptor subunit epsilon isoform X2 [Camelus ferus]|uniref:Gamma-aminobutyric acid receptor subunit epsilon isoform X2 n=2 Tax=Camelus TaxID=9836 RepID=A0A8B8SNT3_CAMFR|nr:gamma-aminobutyric acid receptor subunit epsilon isoform X2 [Camelus dromedarius]XP_032331112.1 gamma-aminobutyric acid receptor subunit epsilon isoform X2 [Camelus ferus]XP_045373620.1 gamma-aminobutyric acid receptor subunit epsilon isoform X2 [Camelus bactrianus]
MLAKVLLILLGTSVILPSRIEGPHVESEKAPSASDGDVYDPKSQAPEEKPSSEEIKPTATDTQDRLGKMPTATFILDSLFNNYDYKLRPGIGEKPTVVTVEISVNTLGPISILDMEYSIDITFCQTWYDERLRYDGSFESFVLNGNMVSQLWVPDTFFRNSKRTHEHSMTMPNQMVRIHKDGKVLYTIRMTIDVGCSLHMLKFPMDSHSCPLSFSSFSYPENEIIYKWDNFTLEINGNNSWKLFQFDFIGVTNTTETIATIAGDFVVLTLFFNVSRRFGFVAFQNYVPSSVTTMISWISFWIKRDSAPARTSLALDFYIAICFVFCFCALMEFAVLNFLTYNRANPRGSPKLRHPRARARDFNRPRVRAIKHPDAFVCDIEDSEDSDEEEGPSCPARQSIKPCRAPRPGGCCRWCRKYLCVVPCCEGSMWQQGRLFIHIYRLDNYSRVIFPVTFFFFNVLYWLVCLNL